MSLPLILSERLRILPFQEEDAAGFLSLTQDAGFRAFPITDYRQSGVESALAWIRESALVLASRGLGKLAIWERESSALLGMGGLTPWILDGVELVDLTYRLRESAWGNGYGSEAARAIARRAFEDLGLAEITATITPDNLPSRKVAARLGMKLDRRILLKNVETDLYRLRKGDFINGV